MEFPVVIGRINLARSFNGTGEHFVALVEALDRQRIQQHVVVQNASLAKRLDVYDTVVMGPTTGSPVVAYCYMPAVDVVHAHNERSAQASLLLTLTRSIPFVMTRRMKAEPAGNPVTLSIYKRASGVICTTDRAADALLGWRPDLQVDVINEIARASASNFEMTGNRVAAEHLRLYHRAADRSQVPAVLL